jgi:ketosteroid isomerase-like protein
MIVRIFSRFRPLLALPILAALLSNAQMLAASSADHPSAVPAALQRRQTDWIQGLRNGDTAALVAAYADDVRLMTEHQPTMLGRESARAYHAAFLARFTVDACQRERAEILDLGSQIAEWGRFSATLESRSDHGTLELAGKYLELWQKSPNGQLHLLTHTWNYDHAIQPSDLLRFAAVASVNVAFQPHLPFADSRRFELAALNKLMEATVAQHDAAVWRQFYADDAVLLLNHAPLAAGRAAIDAYLLGHVRELPVFEHLDIRNDRVDDLGRYVIEYASHIANWRNGDASGVNTGKDLRIWRREPDGSLKIFRHIGMYD